MHTIKKTSLFTLFLLNFVTGGVWWPVWFLERRDAINGLSPKEKIGKGGLIFSTVALCLSALWSLITWIMLDYGGINIDWNTLIYTTVVGITINLMTLVASIILTIDALKVRRILIDHFNIQMGKSISFSLLWTLLFQIFYLQYKINRLVTD